MTLNNTHLDCLLDKTEVNNQDQSEKRIIVSCPNNELQTCKFGEFNKILKDDNKSKFEILLKIAYIHIIEEESIKY